ncbi:MAG TPA: hypothetical protein PLX89_07245 [Verrucomicrobiota bacterium]|nr:hypothetical protein [Verrucomicrobiota bacterium]
MRYEQSQFGSQSQHDAGGDKAENSKTVADSGEVQDFDPPLFVNDKRGSDMAYHAGQCYPKEDPDRQEQAQSPFP